MPQKRNFGAKAGEQIVGNLFRGKSGKFQSGPTDAGLKKLGIERELSDALINALNNKQLTPEQLQDLQNRGFMDESGILTRNGRSLALALRSKNLTNAKKILSKVGKKKSGGGGGGKADNKNKSRGLLKKQGFSQKLIDALFSFFDGEEIEKEQVQKFEQLGLVQINEKGVARLTTPGRTLRTAVNAGDDRKLQDSLLRGQELAKRNAKKKTESTDGVNNMDEETTEMRDEFSEMFPYLENAYVAGNVTSFEQLGIMKQASEIRKSVYEITEQFQQLVNNIVFGETENKIDALQSLFSEFTEMLRELSGDLSEEFEEIKEKAFPVHHTDIVENEPWDGPKAVLDAQNDRKILKHMHAWMVEGGDPNLKQSYKFPHHAPAVDSPANIRGVNNGLARLSQANIPDADRAGIEKHLRAHRTDAGLKEFMDHDELKTAVNTVALSESMTKQEKSELLAIVAEQEIEFAENHPLLDVAGTAVELMESESTPDTPVLLDVRLIQPGWGNKKDNHYYPKQMLERDAHIFENVKMHVTNHDFKEQNDRFWVSTITESGKRFTEDGAPIVRVAIHNPSFARSARNLNELNLLHMLQCSIVASGKVKPNFTENGRSGAIVESMNHAKSVDWVTRAGAGGQALNLIENFMEDETMNEQEQETDVNEQETQDAVLSETNEETTNDETTANNEEPTNDEETAVDESHNEPTDDAPVLIERAEIDGVLNKSTLPDVAKMKLLEMDYASIEELETAVQKEIDYIAQIAGNPQPHQFNGDGGGGNVSELDSETSDERFNKIFLEFGLE